jgi:putative endonuclease
MYFVYVLLCGDGKHYIGYTEDVVARLKRHQNREVLSTKGRQPVELVFYEAFKHMQDAKRREGYLKTTAGNRALKLMLRRYYGEKL